MIYGVRKSKGLNKQIQEISNTVGKGRRKLYGFLTHKNKSRRQIISSSHHKVRTITKCFYCYLMKIITDQKRHSGIYKKFNPYLEQRVVFNYSYQINVVPGKSKHGIIDHSARREEGVPQRKFEEMLRGEKSLSSKLIVSLCPR